MASMSVTPTSVATRLQHLEVLLPGPPPVPPPVLLWQPDPAAPPAVQEKHRRAIAEAEAAGSMVILRVLLDASGTE